MIRFNSILFLSSTTIAAAAFWYFFGRSLQYVVGYGNDGGWTENFSALSRICITILIALLFGLLITWLAYAYRHEYSSAASRKRASNPMATMNAITIHDTITRDGIQFLGFDLRDILGLARERVSASTWVCDDVECIGRTSDEVHASSDSGTELSGGRFLELADGIDQTIDGNFTAYISSGRPWCVIRAIDGSEFVVITDDTTFLAELRRRFIDVRDSPGDVEYVV